MNSLLTDSFKTILKFFSRDKVSGSCLFTIPNKQGKNQKPVLCLKEQEEELLKEGLLK